MSGPMSPAPWAYRVACLLVVALLPFQLAIPAVVQASIPEEVIPEGPAAAPAEAAVRPASLRDGASLAPEAASEVADQATLESLETLIRTTGAEAIDYPERILCCGGPILAISEDSSSEMAKRVLDGAKAKEPDALTVICPFCNVMYSEYQSAIGEKHGVEYNMPVFFLPQLLGIAMGFNPKDLRIKRKSERYRDFFKKLEEGQQ